MSFRKYLVLASIVFFGSVGDVLLSRGMRDIGQIHLANWTQAITSLFNPWVAIGVVVLIVFFGRYLAALSWADLTYVLPATAIGYVVLALISMFFLHEQMSLTRWAGIVLITVGVGFVAGGPSLTERAEAKEAADLVRSHEQENA